MTILSIETSCDETAISIVEKEGESDAQKKGIEEGSREGRFRILSQVVLSQIDIHKEYGGVFPALAKREHAKNLVPILKEALEKAGMLSEAPLPSPSSKKLSTGYPQPLYQGDALIEIGIQGLLEREPGLFEALSQFATTYTPPRIDAIAVTQGPGLEPALWVGVNFAKALSLLWEKPLIPTNHMEGHLFSAFVEGEEFAIPSSPTETHFPLAALLVSGGHTEIILVRAFGSYERLGQTRDDAVGEAFDKVARVLDLPYPGGPEISKLAEEGASDPEIALPRPMLTSDDYDFSFSGLKTAVLYLAKRLGTLTHAQKASIAKEFQDAAIEVLTKKTLRAARTSGARGILLGGGVAANKELRRILKDKADQEGFTTLIPDPKTTTDNATMIALAGFFNEHRALTPGTPAFEALAADGNLAL